MLVQSTLVMVRVQEELHAPLQHIPEQQSPLEVQESPLFFLQIPLQQLNPEQQSLLSVQVPPTETQVK